MKEVKAVNAAYFNKLPKEERVKLDEEYFIFPKSYLELGNYQVKTMTLDEALRLKEHIKKDMERKRVNWYIDRGLTVTKRR